jgi:hypothetical protein
MINSGRARDTRSAVRLSGGARRNEIEGPRFVKVDVWRGRG